MKEIVTRLHENRQIELAKSILEANGYKVSKKVNESVAPDIKCDEVLNNAQAIRYFQDILENPISYGYEDEDSYLKIVKILLDIVKKDKDAVYYADLFPVDDYEKDDEIVSTGNNYLYKGTIYIDEDEYSGYIDGNRDGVMSFLLTDK